MSNGSAPTAPAAKVFISYSRKDLAFVDRLEPALAARGVTALVDRSEIYAFEDWWKRIEALIAQADTIVFVLSPDAIASEVCQREVAFAAALNKRFAPIVCRPVDVAGVPEELRRLNFVDFTTGAFEAQADRLAEALQTNIGWIRKHTEFGAAALQWDGGTRMRGLLLRSPRLEEAEQWIATRPHGAPLPTATTQLFVTASRWAATRRRNFLTGTLGAGFAIAMGLAGFALWQRDIAQTQRQAALAAEEVADKERRIAVAQRDRALVTQSRFLASTSNAHRAVREINRAMVLALEALPSDPERKERPYLPEAELALRFALRDAQALLFSQAAEFPAGDGVTAVALSPGADLVAIATGGSVRLADPHSGAGVHALPEQGDPVWALRFLADGRQLILASDRRLRVFDLARQAIVLTIDAKPGQRICGWYHTPSNEPNLGFRVGVMDAAGPTDRLHATSFDAAGGNHMVLVSAHCTSMYADLQSFGPMIMQDGHVIDMRSNGVDLRMVLITRNLRLGIMATEGGFRLAPEAEKYLFAVVSPDGAQAAAAMEDGTVVVWDTRHFTKLTQFPSAGRAVVGMNFSADGHRLLIAHADATVRIWQRLSASEFTVVASDPAPTGDGLLRRCDDVAAGVTQTAGAVTRRLVVESGRPVLHRQEGAAARTLQLGAAGATVRDLALSPNGQRAFAVRQPEHPMDKIVSVYDADTGALVRERRFAAGEGARCSRISPDGERLATLDPLRLSVHDTTTGDLVRTTDLPFNGGRRFLSTAFSPNGARLALHLDDGTLALIDAQTVTSVDEATWARAVAAQPMPFYFEPDGRRLRVGAQGAGWSVFATTYDLVTTARSYVGLCVAPGERTSFSLGEEPPDWCIELRKPPYDQPPWQTWLTERRAGRSPALPVVQPPPAQ